MEFQGFDLFIVGLEIWGSILGRGALGLGF